MDTNIDKKEFEENAELHKKVLALLKLHLGWGYVAEAQKRLAKINIAVSDASIRQIKTGQYKDWNVLEVLTEMAVENQRAVNAIHSMVNSENKQKV